MTDAARFRALSWALRERRRGPFELRIDGLDPLRLHAEDVTFEGAATSLQLHLRVPPEYPQPSGNLIFATRVTGFDPGLSRQLTDGTLVGCLVG